MEIVKGIAKTVAIKVVVLSIGLFYTCLVAIGMLIKSLFKGKEYWYVKERTLPPLILTDPSWGRHSHVTLKDVKIHYVEKGDRSKPLMLFVHGFPEFWFSWRNQLKHFADDYWVVAIDMRGYGESDKPTRTSAYTTGLLERDIVHFVKALEKDRCILVGHDWGGLVSWSVAANFPEIVDKLIIMNSPHPTALTKKLLSSLKQFLKSWYIFAFQIPYIPEKYFHTQDLEVFRDMFENTLSEEELEAYKYNWGRPGAFTPPINYYRNSFDPSGIFLNPVGIPTILAPCLIIWGENDIALDKDLAEMSKPYVKNLQIVYIPNANHFVQNDKPDEVNEIMEKFLQSS